MARIAGVDLPLNKRIDVALTYIYGIGAARSARILATADVPVAVRVKDLTEEQTKKIRQIITDEGRVEGDLRTTPIPVTSDPKTIRHRIQLITGEGSINPMIAKPPSAMTLSPSTVRRLNGRVSPGGMVSR